MNVYVKSNTGDIQINGMSLQKSDLFGAQSINIENSGIISIKAKTEITSELALEYMISSAFRTTIGSFSCHSLFFLVVEL